MTTPQVIAIGWGVFAVIFGAVFVTNRHSISRAAQRRHGPRQTPGLMAFGGVFFIIAGIAAAAGGATGVLT